MVSALSFETLSGHASRPYNCRDRRKIQKSTNAVASRINEDK